MKRETIIDNELTIRVKQGELDSLKKRDLHWLNLDLDLERNPHLTDVGRDAIKEKIVKVEAKIKKYEHEILELTTFEETLKEKLENIRSRFENGENPTQLMNIMESEFEIPMISWQMNRYEKCNPDIMELYTKISDSRAFEN